MEDFVIDGDYLFYRGIKVMRFLPDIAISMRYSVREHFEGDIEIPEALMKEIDQAIDKTDAAISAHKALKEQLIDFRESVAD